VSPSTVSGVGGEGGCVLAFLWLWCFSWYISLFHCVSGQLFGADDVAPASTLTTTSAAPSAPLSAGPLSPRTPISSSAAVLPLSLRVGYLDSPSPAIPSSSSVRSRLGLSASAARPLPPSSSAVEPTISVLPSATSVSSSLRPVPSPCVSMSADARFARMEATLAAVNQRLTRERVSAPEVRRSRSPPEDRDDRHDERVRRGRGRNDDPVRRRDDREDPSRRRDQWRDDRDEDPSRRRDQWRDDRDEDPSRRRGNSGGRGGRGRGSGH
jgi:hypothetical protein